jgi:shikimate dehydrogenase
MTDRYAVVGHPVAHSLSPEIHAAFARQTGQDIDYVKLPAPLDGFAATVLKFRDEGGKGVNVTLPFKHEAWSLAGERAGDAAAAGAVNTIVFKDGKISGHNTDGLGLVADLEQNLRFALRDKRVLLMGAGGATYGVMQPLLKARPRQVVVANRTLAKVQDLVAHFEKFAQLAQDGTSARSYAGLAGAQFDLVINATSAGLQDEMPPLPAGIFAAGALAYDMVYGKQTPFMKFAQKHGARTADGLGMLVEQAAEAFFIWHGVRPDTSPVIEKLRIQDSGIGIR